jgi:hypothetical protein
VNDPGDEMVHLYEIRDALRLCLQSPRRLIPVHSRRQARR